MPTRSYSTGNSGLHYVAVWMGGVWGRRDTCIWIHVRLIPFAVHLELSQLCLSAILQYIIKFKKLNTLGIKGIYLNIVRGINEKSTAYILHTLLAVYGEKKERKGLY